VTQDSAKADHDSLDQELSARLGQLGFTGRIEATLEQRLGRHVDQRRANLGRLLWFDTIGGLNNDNTCAGCHSPTNAFGDTQSIAIGIDNNGIVGPHRVGLSMPEASFPIPPGFDALSKAEQVRYLQALWDQISEEAVRN